MTVREKIEYLPHDPGVYRYLDAGGKVDLALLKPIVFDASGVCYRALGDVVGKAWDAGKGI